MNQEELRTKLLCIIEKGLTSKAISRNTDIPSDILSRFKNAHACLCEKDAVALNNFLDKVIIP